jgi:hypothetical protein
MTPKQRKILRDLRKKISRLDSYVGRPAASTNRVAGLLRFSCCLVLIVAKVLVSKAGPISMDTPISNAKTYWTINNHFSNDWCGFYSTQIILLQSHKYSTKSFFTFPPQAV